LKGIIIYFSLTGNTSKMAQAIQKGMRQVIEKCDIVRINNLISISQILNTYSLNEYDLIGVGCPCWGGGPPFPVRLFIENMTSLHGKYTFTFSTSGARPEIFIPRMARLLAKKGLTVIGYRNWYASAFLPIFPKPYLTDGHPDEIDLKEAEDFGKEMVDRTRQVLKGETRLIPSLPELLRITRRGSWYGTPRLNTQKCLYPKCHICMDRCPMNAIDLSTSPPTFAKNCKPCFFCEMICPTGAIEMDYEPGAKMVLEDVKNMFEKAMEKAEAEGRFRRLIPKEKVGWNTPYFILNSKHPRFRIAED
jgi:Fe-S-cluster-containing hydrogenase component 2/flavodoxin